MDLERGSGSQAEEEEEALPLAAHEDGFSEDEEPEMQVSAVQVGRITVEVTHPAGASKAEVAAFAQKQAKRKKSKRLRRVGARFVDVSSRRNPALVRSASTGQGHPWEVLPGRQARGGAMRRDELELREVMQTRECWCECLRSPENISSFPLRDQTDETQRFSIKAILSVLFLQKAFLVLFAVAFVHVPSLSNFVEEWGAFVLFVAVVAWLVGGLVFLMLWRRFTEGWSIVLFVVLTLCTGIIILFVGVELPGVLALLMITMHLLPTVVLGWQAFKSPEFLANLGDMKMRWTVAAIVGGIGFIGITYCFFLPERNQFLMFMMLLYSCFNFWMVFTSFENMEWIVINMPVYPVFACVVVFFVRGFMKEITCGSSDFSKAKAV